MKYIDFDNWERKEHFDFFHRMDYPQFNISINIDITHLATFAKKNGLSFYFTMIHAVTAAINEMENFRYRIKNEQVVLHEKIHPCFTFMDGNSDLFKLIVAEMDDDVYRFSEQAKRLCEAQQEFFPREQLSGRDDLIYITCIPWLSFTHISHTFSLNKNDSVPRIAWGKYYPMGEKILLPFSVQANHALVDGYHVAKLVEKVESMTNRILPPQ